MLIRKNEEEWRHLHLKSCEMHLRMSVQTKSNINKYPIYSPAVWTRPCCDLSVPLQCPALTFQRAVQTSLQQKPSYPIKLCLLTLKTYEFYCSFNKRLPTLKQNCNVIPSVCETSTYQWKTANPQTDQTKPHNSQRQKCHSFSPTLLLQLAKQWNYSVNQSGACPLTNICKGHNGPLRFFPRSLVLLP